MYRKIRIGVVSYLNTLPLVYGLRGVEEEMGMELVFNYPAKVAEGLLDNSLDVGLVPVAILPKLKEAHIISNYCIGASSNVASVSIFSMVPLEEVTHLLLDYQSRTSVNLARVLLKEYWKLHPQPVRAGENFLNEIKGTTAAVVIGDRALRLTTRMPYEYDLADAWMAHTGLPFTFAAWVANKELPAEWVNRFDQKTGEGLAHIPEIVAGTLFPEYDLQHYFTQNIDYHLDEGKRQAIHLFLEKVGKLEGEAII